MTVAKRREKPKSGRGSGQKPKASVKKSAATGRSAKKAQDKPSEDVNSPTTDAPSGVHLSPSPSLLKSSSEARRKSERLWEKARTVVQQNRPSLLGQEGVVGVRATHRFDKQGEPTGLPAITIEVLANLDETKLRPNPQVPKKIAGIPVSVVDIRGGVLLGAADESQVSSVHVGADSGPPPAGTRSLILLNAIGLGDAAPIMVGWGSRIVPLSSSGASIGGFGSVSAVVFHAGDKVLLTCSHVLSANGVPLLDGKVGLLDDLAIPPVLIGNTTEPHPIRGHDSSHDCVVIQSSLNSNQIESRIKDPFNPGEFLDPEPGGHYRADRLTDTDAQDATRVFHVGAVSGGQVGIVSDVDGSLDATGAVPPTPITTGLIVIQPRPHQTFSKPGDSGAPLIRVSDNAIVGIVIGVRNDGATVACHFQDVLDFFAVNSFPIQL
jgi:hypothetical protein